MSPQVQNRLVELLGFPRVSGDEPLSVASLAARASFSPRERG